jgi:hypothetical protein
MSSMRAASTPTARQIAFTVVMRGGKDKGIGPVSTVATQVLARLGALDPKTGRLYLPTAQAKPIPDPGERRTLIPGTFAILVLAPN